MNVSSRSRVMWKARGIILKSLLNIDIDVDRLPYGDERGISIETVIPVNDPVKEAEQIMKY